FLFHHPPTPSIYTLSLHDALPIWHLAAMTKLGEGTRMLTVNLGTGRGHSVLEMVDAFGKASGRSIPYQIVERRPGDLAENFADRSEEHTSELQSQSNLVCRLLLEK